jgi:hypothetical protein
MTDQEITYKISYYNGGQLEYKWPQKKEWIMVFVLVGI